MNAVITACDHGGRFKLNQTCEHHNAIHITAPLLEQRRHLTADICYC